MYECALDVYYFGTCVVHIIVCALVLHAGDRSSSTSGTKKGCQGNTNSQSQNPSAQVCWCMMGVACCVLLVVHAMVAARAFCLSWCAYQHRNVLCFAHWHHEWLCTPLHVCIPYIGHDVSHSSAYSLPLPCTHHHLVPTNPSILPSTNYRLPAVTEDDEAASPSEKKKSPTTPVAAKTVVAAVPPPPPKTAVASTPVAAATPAAPAAAAAAKEERSASTTPRETPVCMVVCFGGVD